LKKNLSQKKEADGVAQGEGPEFKLQYQKKKKKKKTPYREGSSEANGRDTAPEPLEFSDDHCLVM
jgi:hypothetical protein